MRLLFLILLMYSCKNDKVSLSEKEDVIKNLVENDTIINTTFEKHNLKAVYYFDRNEEKGKIVLHGNDINETINLPNPESEAKNFSVESLEETEKGFLLATNYGGGKDYYTRKFFFEIDNTDNKIYLYKYEGSYIDYSANKDWQTAEKNIEPKININTLNISNYIKNSKI